MSGRGKRKWAPEATLVTPDPNVPELDLEYIDVEADVVGFSFEVCTANISVRRFYEFKELLARLCDCEIIVAQLNKVRGTIIIRTPNNNLARASMEDAARFYKNIKWDELPQET